MQVYAVITADIVGSTQAYEVSNEPLRPRLQEVVRTINSKFHDDLAVPFHITLGDEFQGLVHDLTACPLVIWMIRMVLNPLRCRVGVGIGSVASALSDSTLEMEGVAFSMARRSLETAERQSRLTMYRISDDPRIEESANTISLLVDTMQKDWSERQWEAACLYAEHGTTASVGSALHISRQAVEQRLRSAHYYEIREAVGSLSALFAPYAASAS
jgi:hypothetical protein